MYTHLRPDDLALVTQGAEGMPRRCFSVAEIEEMVRGGVIDEDERFELIGGEVVPMTPKGARHVWIKIEFKCSSRNWRRGWPTSRSRPSSR